MADPDPGVLADLLIMAAEVSADQLVATDRAMRDAFGADVANAAHREWTDRLREGVTSVPPAAGYAAPGRAARTLAAMVGGTS